MRKLTAKSFNLTLITFPIYAQIRKGLVLQQSNHSVVEIVRRGVEYTLKTFDIATFDKVITTVVIRALDLWSSSCNPSVSGTLESGMGLSRSPASY